MSLKRDENHIVVGGAYDGTTVAPLLVDAATDELLITIVDTSATGIGTPVTRALRDGNQVPVGMGLNDTDDITPNALRTTPDGYLLVDLTA